MHMSNPILPFPPTSSLVVLGVLCIMGLVVCSLLGVVGLPLSTPVLPVFQVYCLNQSADWHLGTRQNPILDMMDIYRAPKGLKALRL